MRTRRRPPGGPGSGPEGLDQRAAGLEASHQKTPPTTARLRKRLQLVEQLPVADQRTVLKLLGALHEPVQRTSRRSKTQAAS